MDRLIQRMLAPLQRRVSCMIVRVRVARVNSAAKQQRLQVTMLDGDAKDDLEHFEQYGLTSSPPAGAEGVGLFFGGDQSHGATICVGDKRYRLTGLKGGEVALYDDLGQVVHLTRDGIKISSPLDIEMSGRHVRIHGNESLTLECNGHGERWLPDRKDTYTIGAVPGSSNPITPPEIP